MSDLRVLSLVTNTAPFYKNQIKSLDEVNISVTTVALRKSHPEMGVADSGTIKTTQEYLSMYGATLSRQFRSYDLVHANCGTTAPIALLQPTRPVVVTFWGSELRDGPAKIWNMCCQLADEIILPSTSLAGYIEGDVNIIPFGLDTKLFSPDCQSKARAAIGWDNDKTIVLFPYEKNRIIKNHPLAEQVVSDCNHEIELKTVSEVPYEDMPLYMNASDALLLTSKAESGPMVVKEAALCNLPVVTTDVGFTSEVLSDVHNSFVCNSKQELVENLEKVLDTECRSDGREKLVDDVNLQHMGKQLSAVYHCALDRE